MTGSFLHEPLLSPGSVPQEVREAVTYGRPVAT